jgi:hypothetical protein
MPLEAVAKSVAQMVRAKSTTRAKLPLRLFSKRSFYVHETSFLFGQHLLGNTLGNTFGQHPPLFWATLLGNTLRKFGQHFLATHTLYLGNTFWQHTLKFSLVQLWLCHLLQNIMLAICIGIHDGLAKQNWWHLTADVSAALGHCCNNRENGATLIT